MSGSLFQSLTWGATKFDLEKVKASVNHSNINMLDDDGKNLLHIAIAFNRDDVSAYLVSLGINVDQQDETGKTPLHVAAGYSNKGIAALLLQKGADTALKDKFGNEPLWTAAFNARGNYDLVKLFKGHKANPNNKNNAGRSPVDFARQINDEQLVKELLLLASY